MNSGETALGADAALSSSLALVVQIQILHGLLTLHPTTSCMTIAVLLLSIV